jgi:hypothetical protein
MANLSFETVRELGLSFDGVVDGTTYGVPALKLGDKAFVNVPANKSAEANSVVVRIGIQRRAELLEQHPETYYVTDHYRGYPTVLVRLSKITRIELKKLLRESMDFVSLPPAKKIAAKKRAAPAVRKAIAKKNIRK